VRKGNVSPPGPTIGLQSSHRAPIDRARSIMCRVLGSVAAEPVSLRGELLEAANPLIHTKDGHDDSGWGLAAYKHAEGEEPVCARFPADPRSDQAAIDTRARLHVAHVRRATVGDLRLENTHPFCLGPYSFCHNGTIRHITRFADPNVERPAGDTDSEYLFRLLMHHLDTSHPIDGLRYTVQATIERFPFSSLSFLFSDGERLFAYRLGHCELHWTSRPGQLVVASEQVTDDEIWHSVKQDVLLVLDPHDPEAPHAERLVGDETLACADIRADQLISATAE
jgi:predicted glutamine amidotransferase